MGAAWVGAAPSAYGGDFAGEVVSYVPAPGQFVNSPNGLGQIFNDPAHAIGPPIGGGIAGPSNEKVLTLGGFGGSVTLRFASTVLDDPCNPFGLDAILFGNAFWSGGDPGLAFAEPGVIEISLDANGNGLADDAWYVIPGSLIANDPPTIVPDGVFATQDWDNDANTATPPLNTAWYPDDALYGFVPPGFPSSYQTGGWLLPTGGRGIGYADQAPTLLLGDLDGDDTVDDLSITPEEFYTRPDNPWAPGITPGSGGGDAFDIAWAVDSATGAAANLEGFDFIRISTGENATQGVLGEKSTEVGAVADVRGDPLFFDVDGSGGVDVEDLYRWYGAPVDVSGEGVVDGADARMVERCVRRGEAADVVEGRE